MATITIPKKEYQNLLGKALRFEYIQEIMKENLFASPPTCDTKEVIESFKETGKYNDKFLRSLEKGLKRSSYFK